MSERPKLTIAQAIEQFDLSRATMRRGIESGKFTGSTKDPQGRWLVPVDALVAAGIKPRKTWLTGLASERAHELTQGAHSLASPSGLQVAGELAHSESELAHRASRIAQLEAELAAEKRLRESAERNAEDLRSAMRMIEAGTQTPEPSPRRKWWKRD